MVDESVYKAMTTFESFGIFLFVIKSTPAAMFTDFLDV